MKAFALAAVAFFLLCGASSAQVIMKKEGDVQKSDAEIHAEFQKMAKAGLKHDGNFLLDKSGKPLPMYTVPGDKPSKKTRTQSIAPKMKTGMTKTEVINLVGYPDDYLLTIKPGEKTGDDHRVEVEESWFYGNTTLVFDTRQDKLVKIETK